MSRSKGYWIKTLSKFVSVQLVVQALGFASGILLIRNLSKEEYALFILANSMQGMMNVLADSGVGSALSVIGGKVWQDPYRFGQLINTAMQWRRYLAVIAVVNVTPILFWMLVKNGAPTGYAIVLIAGVLIELDFYLRIGVQSTVLRLHSQINRIQRLELLGAGSRITLLVPSFPFLSAGLGIFASTIASGLQAVTLNWWVKNIVDTAAPANQNDQKNIRKLILNQLPNNVFYCIQGQLLIWLISIFGSTQNIAEIGALSRLGVIFSIANSILINIALPSLSRSSSPQKILWHYCQILIVYTVLASFILSFTLLYPKQILWILGGQYAHLSSEVFLIILSAIIHAIYSTSWLVNLSKGWIDQTWILVLTIISAQTIFLIYLDISTIKGIILFDMLPLIPAYVVNLYMTFKGLKSLGSERL